MKQILSILVTVLVAAAAYAGPLPAPPVGSLQQNLNGFDFAPFIGKNYGDCLVWDGTKVVSSDDCGGGGTSLGVVKKLVNSAASNTVYATGGVTTYNSGTGTYTASAGPQPLPATLKQGQIYSVNFNQANPSSANLIIGTFSPIAINVVDASGVDLSLVGGEIVPGPAWLYYDGAKLIYSVPSSSIVEVTGALTITQAQWVGHAQFYLPSGSETITLLCSSVLSPNGGISVFSASGTATLALAASPCTDSVTKNGTSSSTSASVAQGAGNAAVVTDNLGHFYVSGQ